MPYKILVSYVTFAVIATFANISAQELGLWLYSGVYSIVLSVIFGTSIGLVVKFYLDRRYVFSQVSRGVDQETKVFLLYSITSVLTTLIFWAFEFSFYYFFESKLMKYTGACIGLSIGYYAKYNLDKRYVFAGGDL